MAYSYLATFKDGSTHEIKRSGIADYAFAWRVTGLSYGQQQGFSRTAHHASKSAEYAARGGRERGETIATEVVAAVRTDLPTRKPRKA